jgi:flagellar biosynthetic protein FliQ
MNMDQAIDVIREALIVTLIVSGPILAVGLVIGLVISIVQAVTQIQEQTLAFVPKIVAMAVALVLLVPWIGQKLIEFSQQMFMMR